MMIAETAARARREVRLTAFPIEWKQKYPRIHVMRWIVVGTVVAALTGNAQLGKLNPFGAGGLKGAQSALGQTVTSIVAYPLPLTVSVTRWAGKEANHLCTVLSVNCDINPTRNLHYKVRSPFVKAAGAPASRVLPSGPRTAIAARAP